MGSAPLLVSALPFVLLALLYLLVPDYGNRAFREPIRLIGLVVGIVLGALGTFLVSESSSWPRAVLSLLACTLPASYLIAIAPGD